jgi:hypothetical protein
MNATIQTAALEIAADHITYGEKLIAKAKFAVAVAVHPGNKISAFGLYEMTALSAEMQTLIADFADIVGLGLDAGMVRSVRWICTDLTREIGALDFAASVACAV